MAREELFEALPETTGADGPKSAIMVRDDDRRPRDRRVQRGRVSRRR